MRPSYIKVGGSYRPCIRDDAGRVVWQADDVLCTNRDHTNRDHSTSRGPSAMDLARFALDAANDPAKFEALIQREPPEIDALVTACRAAVEYARTCRDFPEYTSGYCIGTDHLQAIEAALAIAEPQECRQP